MDFVFCGLTAGGAGVETTGTVGGGGAAIGTRTTGMACGRLLFSASAPPKVTVAVITKIADDTLKVTRAARPMGTLTGALLTEALCLSVSTSVISGAPAVTSDLIRQLNQRDSSYSTSTG